MTGSAPRTMVLTGVSRGFGLETARSVMKRHPQNHYVVLGRGDAARLAGELGQEAGAGNVSGIDCDLAFLGQVRHAATEIGDDVDHGRRPPLGGYLGNAGLVMSTADRQTSDGYEMTFGVNVLAHYFLLRLLLPHFAAPARIILTTSDTHFGQFRYTLGATPPPRWQSPDQLAAPRSEGLQGGSRAYATSKLATIYLTHALARRLPTGVDVYSYNPALVAGTDLFRDAPRPLRVLLNGFFRAQLAVGRGSTPQRAGAVLADAFAGPLPGPTGSYLDRGRATRSSRESYDVPREEELWRTCARLVGLDADDVPPGDVRTPRP